MTDINKKLIVFDTDGVIFKSQLLLRLSWHSGIIIYLRALFLCLLFGINRLTMRALLERVYDKLKGIKEEEFWRVYYKMKLVRSAEEAIRCIRNNGHYVALISSGVPDFLMRHLAKRLHASYGYGIDTKMDNNIFTGEINGSLSFHEGKVQVVEQILKESNITWNDVIIVGDDRNNLDIMALAKASIGFNSNYSVRKKAKYLADGNDLKQVLNYIELEEDPSFSELSSKLSQEFTHSWRQEFRRKGIHFGAVLVPFFAGVNFTLTLDLMIIITVLFMFSELLRLNGISLPIMNLITRLCIRTGEQRRFTLAPVTLSLGIILSLLLFPKLIACVVIIIVALSDSIATVTGRFYGRIRIPYNHGKTVEGSMAFFVSAFMCSIFFVPLGIALIVSFVSCIIESLPFKIDNISVPLGTGFFLEMITSPTMSFWRVG
ncbi:MAG: HAD-IB family phosphatase [Candidatus Scalindua sediminis]|nr:HAD-IB family phosphatase [Candidatus Scalindua sediminis]